MEKIRLASIFFTKSLLDFLAQNWGIKLHYSGLDQIKGSQRITTATRYASGLALAWPAANWLLALPLLTQVSCQHARRSPATRSPTSGSLVRYTKCNQRIKKTKMLNKKPIFIFMKFIFLVIIVFSCNKKPNSKEIDINHPDFKDTTILKTLYSSSKKYKIEFLKHNFPDERCTDNFPDSLNDKSGICQIRIHNTLTGEIEYRIIAGEEKKISDKNCFPTEFPLSLAYGYISINDNGTIKYAVNYDWFGVSDQVITVNLFDWNSCKTKTIWRYSQLHCASDCIFLTILNTEDHIYLFHYNELNKSVEGQMATKSLEKESDYDWLDDFFEYREDIPILKTNFSTNIIRLPVNEEIQMGTKASYPNILIYIDDDYYLMDLQNLKYKKIEK